MQWKTLKGNRIIGAGLLFSVVYDRVVPALYLWRWEVAFPVAPRVPRRWWSWHVLFNASPTPNFLTFFGPGRRGWFVSTGSSES